MKYVIGFGLLNAIAISMISTQAAAQDAIESRAPTPTPPGIAIPDKVETRLGLLKFYDGFPDDKTTEILFYNLDFQRAVQSYLLAIGRNRIAGMND